MKVLQDKYDFFKWKNVSTKINTNNLMLVPPGSVAYAINVTWEIMKFRLCKMWSFPGKERQLELDHMLTKARDAK